MLTYPAGFMSAVGYLVAVQAQPHISAIAFAHKVVAHHGV
jgi:hypothetical protein